MTTARYGGRLSALRTDRFYPQEYSWYSFSLRAHSTAGSWFGRKEICHWKIHWQHRESIRLVAQRLNHYATPGPLYIKIQGYYSCNAWVWQLLGQRGRLLGSWNVFMYFLILTGELQATAASTTLRIRRHSYTSSAVRKLSEWSSVVKLPYNPLLPMSWRRVIRGHGGGWGGPARATAWSNAKTVKDRMWRSRAD